MNKNQVENGEMELDLGQIARELFNKIWIILLSAGIFAVGALIVSMFFIKPVYQSTTKIYVLERQSDVPVLYADLQMAVQITKDYEQLVKSRYVLDTVSADLGLSVSAGAISVSSQKDTRILEISASNSDPHLAKKIANATRDVASKQILEIMNIDAVNLVDEANFPLSAISPNIRQNVLIGAVAGFALSCGIIILMYMLNDTIRTPDDIGYHLGLSILGIIPLEETVKQKPKRVKKKKPDKDIEQKSA